VGDGSSGGTTDHDLTGDVEIDAAGQWLARGRRFDFPPSPNITIGTCPGKDAG
jgi:hypothetical protein